MAWNRIYCYGDSDTYGYDPRSFLGGRYPKTVRWTALLQQAGWSVQNDGENGRCIPCTDWETQRLQRELRRQQAEALVIMLGCNDLLRQPRRTADACGERMERFLSGLLAWDL